MSLEPDDLGICKRALSLFLAASSHHAINDAESILDDALTSYPQDPELRLYKAHFLLTKGTAPAAEQAVDILQKITEDQPNLSGPWVLWAQIALRQGQSAKAMDIVLRGLFHQPNDKSLLLLKARLETESSPGLAIPTLKALLDAYPNDNDIVLQLANKYSTMGQFQKALNLLRNQLNYCDNITEERKVRIALAIALHKSGNRADAQKQFDLLFYSDPDDTDLLLAQVHLLKNDGLWEQINQKVIDWYQSYPRDPHTPIAIAGYLVESKNSKAEKTAEGILRVILEHDSDCTEAMSALAMLLQTTSRSQEAAELYRQVLTLQPDNVIAINNLAWILCEEQGKYQQALEFVSRGLQKAPDYIDLIDTRGVAYYRLGEFEKAVRDLNKCVNLYPPRTPSLVASHFHLGRALAGLGQKGKAIENLNRTLELNNKIDSLSPADLEETQSLLEELVEGG
jgi:tetratricopeptide (TPR) repeat protein